MPPKAQIIPAGIVRLSNLLTHLNKPPKLALSGVKALRLSLAFQNDHFGARHFVKEDLPRIRYANPDLEIHVDRVRKEKDEQWRPEMELEFENGEVKTLDMNKKWSTTILKELMSVAGGDPWKQHVQESERSGMPIFPGENLHDAEAEAEPKDSNAKPLPSLKEYLAQNPVKKEKVVKATAKGTDAKKTTATAPPPPPPSSTPEQTATPA